MELKCIKLVSVPEKLQFFFSFCVSFPFWSIFVVSFAIHSYTDDQAIHMRCFSAKLNGESDSWNTQNVNALPSANDHYSYVNSNFYFTICTIPCMIHQFFRHKILNWLQRIHTIDKYICIVFFFFHLLQSHSSPLFSLFLFIEVGFVISSHILLILQPFFLYSVCTQSMYQHPVVWMHRDASLLFRCNCWIRPYFDQSHFIPFFASGVRNAFFCSFIWALFLSYCRYPYDDAFNIFISIFFLHSVSYFMNVWMRPNMCD